MECCSLVCCKNDHGCCKTHSPRQPQMGKDPKPLVYSTGLNGWGWGLEKSHHCLPGFGQKPSKYLGAWESSELPMLGDAGGSLHLPSSSPQALHYHASTHCVWASSLATWGSRMWKQVGKTSAKSPKDGDMSWATGNEALEPDGFGVNIWQCSTLSRAD